VGTKRRWAAISIGVIAFAVLMGLRPAVSTWTGRLVVAGVAGAAVGLVLVMSSRRK